MNHLYDNLYDNNVCNNDFLSRKRKSVDHDGRSEITNCDDSSKNRYLEPIQQRKPLIDTEADSNLRFCVGLNRYFDLNRNWVIRY
jgi:hypothetical protein